MRIVVAGTVEILLYDLFSLYLQKTKRTEMRIRTFFAGYRPNFTLALVCNTMSTCTLYRT